jgi:hypothetical protein
VNQTAIAAREVNLIMDSGYILVNTLMHFSLSIPIPAQSNFQPCQALLLKLATVDGIHIVWSNHIPAHAEPAAAFPPRQ